MTTSDVDAIFDLAADSTSPSSSTPPQDAPNPTQAPNTPENHAQSDADASSADSGGALFPKVVKTYKLSEVGEGNPDGTLTISEFANYLTVEAIKAGAGVEGIVDKQNIYTATKAARHPLPVVLVFPDEADQSDLKQAKVYLPVAEATEAYENRPKRGEGGNSTTSKKTQDDLLTDAAKRSITLASIQKRLDRAEEQKAKAVKLLEKSYLWLAEYYKGTEIQNEETQDEANKRALTAAIAERAAKLEEEEALKADAAKQSDIPDEK